MNAEKKTAQEKLKDEPKDIEHEKMELPSSKYVVLIGDGMADLPCDELDGKTPLEVARTPAMDRLARMGEFGRVRTIPGGYPPGSDVANMSLLGYDPKKYYTGRGPLEAAAMGVKMNPEDVAFRCNLVTLSFREGRVYMEDYSAGHISNAEATALIEDLAPLVASRSFELIPGVSYRHLLLWRGGPEGLATVPPHDFTGKDVTEAWHIYEDEPLLYEILTRAITFFHRHPINDKRREKGLNPANALWPWGEGRRPVVATLTQQWDIEGSVIAAVDLIRGLGVWAGLEVVNVPGATGYLDTNYRGKADAALRELETKDIVVVHVEAPDEAGHMGSLKEKIKAIEKFDREVVGPVTDGLREMGGAYRILVATDHYTPVSIRTHSAGPVPFVIYDSMNPVDNPDAAWNETAAKKSPLLLDDGYTIMTRLIGAEPRYVELDPKKKKQLLLQQQQQQQQ